MRDQRMIFTGDTFGECLVLIVLSHPNRVTSREGEGASASPSHQDGAPAPLTWWDSANGLRTCLMIGETTDGVGCLTYMGYRR